MSGGSSVPTEGKILHSNLTASSIFNDVYNGMAERKPSPVYMSDGKKYFYGVTFAVHDSLQRARGAFNTPVTGLGNALLSALPPPFIKSSLRIGLFVGKHTLLDTR
jgi:hypothetical protein